MPISDEDRQYIQPIGEGPQQLALPDWPSIFRDYFLNYGMATPSNKADSGLAGLRSMFLNRGGVESGGRAVPRVPYEEFASNLKNATVPPEVDFTQLTPKTTQQKAVTTLNNWDAITKENFVDDFTKRHGSLGAKAVDKIWEYFKYEGVISEYPNVFGFHPVDHEAVSDLLKFLYKPK